MDAKQTLKVEIAVERTRPWIGFHIGYPEIATSPIDGKWAKISPVASERVASWAGVQPSQSDRDESADRSVGWQAAAFVP